MNETDRFLNEKAAEYGLPYSTVKYLHYMYGSGVKFHEKLKEEKNERS